VRRCSALQAHVAVPPKTRSHEPIAKGMGLRQGQDKSAVTVLNGDCGNWGYTATIVDAVVPPPSRWPERDEAPEQIPLRAS
jgi:hypothetical protein